MTADVRGFDLTRNVPSWMAGAVYVPYGLDATMEDGRIPMDMTLAVRTVMGEGEVAELVRRVATA